MKKIIMMIATFFFLGSTTLVFAEMSAVEKRVAKKAAKEAAKAAKKEADKSKK